MAIPHILGLTHKPNYLSQEHHDHLCPTIDHNPWLTDLRRRVQHYGWRYDYVSRQIRPDQFLGPLPSWLQRIAEHLHHDGYFTSVPDQVIINEYMPGQGIARHIDCEPCFGPVIATISLCSAINFDLYLQDQHETIRLEPCSLLILQDAARHQWQHGITPRKADTLDGQSIPRQRRLSLTFRTILR